MLQKTMKSNNTLVKNYIYNLVYKILAVFIPIITTPYLSRVLGAENIGIYSYSLSIVTYFILFGSLGVTMYGQREIAYVQNDDIKRSKIFFEVFIMKLCALSISLILFYFSFCLSSKYSIYYRILTLEVISNMLDISWFFQGMENFKQIVIKNSIVKILSIICIFTFIKNENCLLIYFIIYVLSNLFGNMSYWLNLNKYINKVKIRELKPLKHLRPALILLIPQIAMEIYTVLDKTMIGIIIIDKAEVGYYEQAQKMVKMALSIVTSLGTVMMPRMSSIFSSGDKKKLENYIFMSFSFVLFLAFPITFGLISITPSFVPIYFGSGYEKVTLLMILISPIIIAIGCSNILGIQYLIPCKKQKEFTISVTIGAMINFVLNIILIPMLNSIGASIATVFAEFSVTITQITLIRKEINFSKILKVAYKYIIASILMFITSILVGSMISNNILSIIVQIIASLIVYINMLILLKDKMIYEGIRIIKNKLFVKKICK